MHGKLLIAHPLLDDCNFSRSVIYLTDKSKGGIIGFNLSCKSDFLLRDIKPHIYNGDFPVYDGGPVGRNQLFYLHTLGEDIRGSIEIAGGISFAGDFNHVAYLIEHRKIWPHQIKFFIGYSGWAPGQLEAEIKKRHWLINNPSDNKFFSDNSDTLWQKELSKIKSSYSIFADFGGDPCMN